MKLLLLTALAAFAIPAQAFNVDGFRSGMTVEELKNFAARQQLDFRSLESAFGSYQHIIGTFSTFSIVGSFSSCNGIVFAYHRTIDPDVAHSNLAEDLLKRYGQPKVSLERLQVHQRPGVMGSSLKLTWYAAADRIALEMTPELRDGQGGLIFRRGASIEYTVRNACIKDF